MMRHRQSRTKGRSEEKIRNTVTEIAKSLFIFHVGSRKIMR